MWFLTIESIALLVVATTLGLFSGWLVWGGKPALVSAPVVEDTSAFEADFVDPAAFDTSADLVVDEQGFDEASQSIASHKSGAHFAGLLADATDDQDVDEFSHLLEGKELGVAARLSPAEIDPGAIESVVENEWGIHPSSSNAIGSLGSDTGFLSDQTVASALTSLSAENSVAADSTDLVSFDADQAVTGTAMSEQAKRRITGLEIDLEAIAERLKTREEDVVRLKAKLRKAVEEIEKRTAGAQAARAELLDYQEQIARDLAAKPVEIEPSNAASRDGHDDFAPSGTRFTTVEIDELVQARTASLLILTSQLERRTALIQSRAEEAESRVVALKAEAAEYQQETEAALAKAEHDATNRILALEVDLASARQRTNIATRELMGFGSEIAAVRETNAKHLQVVHETMRDLQHRLDATKAALAGRSIAPSTPSSPSAFVSGLVNSRGTSLLALPAMTSTLVDSLAELGVTSLEDVASWTAEDISQIQSWLPEDPEIVERNGWVAVAQLALRENTAPTEA